MQYVVYWYSYVEDFMFLESLINTEYTPVLKNKKNISDTFFPYLKLIDASITHFYIL